MTEVIGPPPPFDQELAATIAVVRQRLPDLAEEMARGVDIQTIVDGMRERMADMVRDIETDLTGGGAFTVSEHEAPGPDRAPDVPLVVCLPDNAPAPVGAIYYIHGGGMIDGDRYLGADNVVTVADELDVAIVSVEYRLAPEHPHPAPVEDCYAGLVWTVKHAEELGIDPGRIAVMGGSAGGGLAAGIALLARDRGGPSLIGQLLACPMLDDRNDTYSARQMAGIGLWDRTANQLGWTALLGEARGGPDVSPYAAPARAGDLSRLPPAFIDVGSAETFRDEAVEYAARIWQAGGVAELHVWPGGFHGFAGMAPQAAVSQAARAAQRAWLRRLFKA